MTELLAIIGVFIYIRMGVNYHATLVALQFLAKRNARDTEELKLLFVVLWPFVLLWISGRRSRPHTNQKAACAYLARTNLKTAQA